MAATAVGVGVALAGREAFAYHQVPVPLQAELVSKAAAYDRRLASKVNGKLRLLSVYDGEDADSAAVAILFRNRIKAIGKVGGYPVQADIKPFTDAEDLADTCRGGIAVLYLSTGLHKGMPKIAESLNGVSVFSIAAEARCVPRGAVLGFDLVGGRPKMLVHLKQAKAQNVQLRSSLLKLAEIVG